MPPQGSTARAGRSGPVLSASGMKSAGGNIPLSGCIQRTSASTPTISSPLEVDDRLIMEDELFFLDRRLELDLAIDLIQQLGAEPGTEHLATTLAAVLGRIHRHVGVAEQSFRGLRPVDAERYRRPNTSCSRVPGHLDRFGSRLDDPGGYLDRVERLGHLLEEDRELISPEPSDRVGSPRAGAQTLAQSQAITRRRPRVRACR